MGWPPSRISSEFWGRNRQTTLMLLDMVGVTFCAIDALIRCSRFFSQTPEWKQTPRYRALSTEELCFSFRAEKIAWYMVSRLDKCSNVRANERKSVLLGVRIVMNCAWLFPLVPEMMMVLVGEGGKEMRRRGACLRRIRASSGKTDQRTMTDYTLLYSDWL